jgi:hypothetical protein
MNDKTTLQNHLESFKFHMKEVNESLYKFESESEKEKAKIENLKHSFITVVKLINSEMLKTMKNVEDLLKLSNLKE